MPLTVGTLTVRRVRQMNKLPSGVLRPRVFTGEPTDFADEPGQRRVGRVLHSLPGGVVARAQRYTPNTATPDQLYAEDYVEACRALSRTPAGRRATELLYNFLSDEQRRTAERFGYFDVFIHRRHRPRGAGSPIEFRTVRARIQRTFPNGNIVLTAPTGDDYQVCLHPSNPYPLDDICLSQMMTFVNDPDEFVRRGNINKRGVARRFTRMFEELTDESLVLPYVREKVGAAPA